jgi:hypothetical protein
MAEAVRSAGTLIGAILESAGYHYQSYLLDALKSPLENEVGGLIYLLGIAVAVLFTATQGGFKMGSWLLIGPPLFFAVIQIREPIPNARWEFGMQPRNQEEVDKGVNQVLPEESEANVSKLFSRYVQLISAVTKEIVSKISVGRSNADLWFIMKGEIFSLMHTARVDDIGFQQMLHHALNIQCGEVVKLAKKANSAVDRTIGLGPMSDAVDQAKQYDTATKQAAEAEFNKLYKTKSINLSPDEARYVATKELGAGATEAQINARAETLNNQAFSCFNVWQFVIQGLNDKGKRVLEDLNNLAKDNAIKPEVVQNLMLQIEGVPRTDPTVYDADKAPSISSGDTELISRIIAKYYLRNEDGNPDMNSWITYFANRQEGTNIKLRMQRLNAWTEQRRVHMKEWSEKERIIHAAASLPYYQGLALYFLGLSFPFFALLLLIPGKFGGFMLWFTIWLWVKSWDIGLAVVMLLSDMLFAILAVEHQGGKVRELDNELGLAMSALQEMDPTFQLATFYTIISACVLAIPAVTAQLVLGSMSAGALLISKGTQKYSDHFNDAMYTHATGAAQWSGRSDMSAAVEESTKTYMDNFRKGRTLAQGLSQSPMGQMATIGSNTKPEARPPAGGPYDVPRFGAPTYASPRIGDDAGRAAAMSLAFEAGNKDSLANIQKERFLNVEDDGLADGVFKTLTASRHQSKQQSDNITATEDKLRLLTANVAAWQSVQRQKMALINREMLICGGLPLPYTVTMAPNEPSASDLEVAIRDVENKASMNMAKIKSTQDVTEGLLSAAEKITGKKFLNFEKMQQGTTPQQRSSIWKEFMTRTAISGGFAASQAYNFNSRQQVLDQTTQHFDELRQAQDQWSNGNSSDQTPTP